MQATDLVVIGAGPGGLSAAITAAQAGARVVLVDERPLPGGQYLGGKQQPVSATERQGQALLGQLARSSVDLRSATLAWDLAPDLRVSLLGPGRVEHLRARAVILACGARELVLPFPGWVLPGVMTAGAAQLLVKKSGVVPGRRVLLAGSGPLLLPAAYGLIQQGATVVGVLEAGRPADWLRGAPAAWGGLDRIPEAWHYLRCLVRARVSYRFGWAVVRALGSDRLEAAVIARLDRSGHAVPGTELTIAVDTLCMGFGLLPNIELTQVAGCAHHFSAAAGGWVPTLDDRLQSSVPGLYVAGESGGIGGAAAAMTEGRLAAWQALARLGGSARAYTAAEWRSLAGRRQRQRRFGAMLNTLFAPPSGLQRLVTSDTPICRCEEVLAAEVRAAAGQGIRRLDELKTRTRAGQGRCQGRTCGPLAARLIAGETGTPLEEAGCFHVRPPVRPVPLSALTDGSSR